MGTVHMHKQGVVGFETVPTGFSTFKHNFACVFRVRRGRVNLRRAKVGGQLGGSGAGWCFTYVGKQPLS